MVAVEPLPDNYNIMLKNLELNPTLKARIIPINVAVSGIDGFVEFKHDYTVCVRAVSTVLVSLYPG